MAAAGVASQSVDTATAIDLLTGGEVERQFDRLARRMVRRRKTDCRTSKHTGRGKHITLPPLLPRAGSGGALSAGASMLVRGGEQARLISALRAIVSGAVVCRVKLHVLCQSADPDDRRRKKWHIGTLREGWDGAQAGWQLFMYCPGYGMVEAIVDSVERSSSVTTAVRELVAKLSGYTSSGWCRVSSSLLYRSLPLLTPCPDPSRLSRSGSV